jgi:membrane-bound lytic murein transglycosylase D
MSQSKYRVIAFLILMTSCSSTGTKNRSHEKASTLTSLSLQPTRNPATSVILNEQNDLPSSEATDEDVANTIETSETDLTEEDKAQDIIAQLLNEETKTQTVSPEFMTIRMHPLVKGWISYFTEKERDRFIRFMTNGAKYRMAIEKILDEEGVPKELFFVGLIESGYFLKAKSHASAVGPWQFIKPTGKRYGLIISKSLDERKDLYKATRAAAQYFRDLYKIFGNWELALSAYNSGEYGMMRRIKKANTEDFFSLATNGYLHPETVNYVPKVMAVMHIYQHLSDYEFPQVKQDNPFEQTAMIKLKHAQPLSLIARGLSVDTNLLQNLNPEINGLYTPYLPNKLYELRLPLKQWQAQGQKLSYMLKSRTYHFSSESNHVLKSVLKKNAPLKITAEKMGKLIKTKRPLLYTVQKGDHLTQLAEIFNSQVNQLRKTNKLSSNNLKEGQRLIIPNIKRTYYLVQRGESIASVAKKFKNSAHLLKRLNQLEDAELLVGQKLLVVLN